MSHQVTTVNDVEARDHGNTAGMCSRCAGSARHSYSLDLVLYKAANKGHHQCVDVLLKAGADVNNFRSSLLAAVENGHDKCVDILIKAELMLMGLMIMVM